MFIRQFIMWAKETFCNSCGHARRLHSFIGCEERGCGCMVKYMDKDMFS